MVECSVPNHGARCRLDVWLALWYPGLSRARWQALIQNGHVLVDGRHRKPRHLLSGGEQISYVIPPTEPLELEPEAIPLDILFEDDDLIAVNKSPGMVTHPAPGHTRGTLVHALLHHCENLAGIGGTLRPGIIHRLDKDTSGIILAAKSQVAMSHLQAQFKQRKIAKKYLAILHGSPTPRTGKIDAPIGRKVNDRKKMGIWAPHSRQAISHYNVLEDLRVASLVEVRIKTGRTHQIRVHLASIGCPVVGDGLYGGGHSHEEPHAIRQMLHAHVLAFQHPTSETPLLLTAPVPDDMSRLLDTLSSNTNC